MSTLIVPCLGRRIVNGIPQYLNRHPNGRLLIEHSIAGIWNDTYSRLLIVILKDDADNYQADTLMKTELSAYSPEIVLLDSMTSGPAETVYLALQKVNVTGSFVVKDSDNYLKTESVPQGNFVAGLDLNSWERDIHNLRNKSFLIVNEQGNLLDIIEKQVRSEVICLGLYGFKKAEDFKKAYEHLNDASYPISRLYLSHVISYLIGYSGRVFHYVNSLEYENWGDERLWKEMQRDYTLYFVDLDNILGSSCTLSESIKEKLLLLQNRGAYFIGYTVNDDNYKTAALQAFEEAEIHFLKVVYGCPYSERKEIILSDEDLNRKTVEL